MEPNGRTLPKISSWRPKTRDALLAAVAIKSFHLFADVLRQAVAGLEYRERLRANALAYLLFGRERSGLYQLMFGSPLLFRAGPHSEIVLAARACFDLLLAALQGATRGRESVRDAVGVRALLQGIVQLERFHLLDGLRTRDVAIDAVVDDLLGSPSSLVQAYNLDKPVRLQ